MTKHPRPHRAKIERRKIISEAEWHEWRRSDVTASVVGCLFGVHPWQTPAGLWAAKTGVVALDETPESAVMRRGRKLERVVAEMFMDERPGWKLVKPNLYLRDPVRRIGATPDFYVFDPQGRRGCLQTKTVQPSSFRRHWSDSSPMWVNLQCLTETMLARAEFGIIAALEVGDYKFDLHIFDVPVHQAAWRRIQDAVTAFWADIEAGREPKIDYERDGPLLAALFPHEEPGKVADLRQDNLLPELLARHENNKAELKRLKDQQEKIETEVKAKMRDAESALTHGFRVTWKEQHRKEYTVPATSFRVLRIAEEKERAA